MSCVVRLLILPISFQISWICTYLDWHFFCSMSSCLLWMSQLPRPSLSTRKKRLTGLLFYHRKRERERNCERQKYAQTETDGNFPHRVCTINGKCDRLTRRPNLCSTLADKQQPNGARKLSQDGCHMWVITVANLTVELWAPMPCYLCLTHENESADITKLWCFASWWANIWPFITAHE